jgi:hypothetical protein
MSIEDSGKFLGYLQRVPNAPDANAGGAIAKGSFSELR